MVFHFMIIRKSDITMEKKHGKTRSDRPSGRQTMEQPEQASSRKPARSSLHQGQGPDFQTQDDTIAKKNPGLKDLYRKSRGPHQQPFNDSIGVDEDNKNEAD